MNAKKEISLTQDEIKQLLQGTLLWKDIALRADNSIRRSGIRQLGESPDLMSKANRDFEYKNEDYVEPERLIIGNPLKAEESVDEGLMDEGLVEEGLTESEPTMEELFDVLFGRKDKDSSGLPQEKSKPLKGGKVIFLLSLAGTTVFGLWFYYFITF